MPGIFLSHSSKDKPLARQIANDLQQAGIKFWLDEAEIFVGDSITQKIQEGLTEADFVAVLLTRHSVASGWVEREWQSKVSDEIHKRKVVILPIKGEDCDVPPLLRDKRCADLSLDYQTGIRELITAIKHHSGETTAPLIEPRLLGGHHFLCYAADGKAFALKLYDTLAAAGVPVWIDQRDVPSGADYNMQVVEALQTCHSLLFVLTSQSVANCAECSREWKRALSYKKPIIPLQLDATVEIPFELEGRKPIVFTGVFEDAVKRLRERLRWLTTPAGQLELLQDRLADAQRALRQTSDPLQQTRAQSDIDQLQKDIIRQEQIVKNPQAAAERVQQSIERGIERERQPEKPVSGQARQKFINPPPGVAPTYFQDRYLETKLVADFLKHDARRLLIIAGRAGIGKTAMVCRLLKELESGQLPDNIGALRVDGIVYLSAVGTRKINIPHLYADLCKLLPPEIVAQLDQLYKDPHVTTQTKMAALLEHLGVQASCLQSDTQAGCLRSIILLLDNFEDTLSPETRDIADAELDEGLKAMLTAPQHPVKVIITTRIPPKALMLTHPERQQTLRLDDGLDSPYAENILREMDVDGKVGLKNAPENVLTEAKERTLGYPRALEALFAILAADRDTTLPDILADTEQSLPDNVVETLVGEMFNRLDLPAQRVMQALAIYNRPVTATAVDYLLEPYLPGVDSAAVLSRLVNMQFVRKEAGKYYLHPIDRAYALARIPKGNAEDREKVNTKPSPFTHFALCHNGAEYFKQIRQPIGNWQTIDNLAPQLTEFDLRYAGQDYDTATALLLEIDFDYLLLRGHYRLMIELHEHLKGKINDLKMKGESLRRLGLAYANVGQVQKAIILLEEALIIARESKDRWNESRYLSNLGTRYAQLGQPSRAINYFQQALEIARESGNRQAEVNSLGNLGEEYIKIDQNNLAINYFQQTLTTAREIGFPLWEGHALNGLGDTYVTLGQFSNAIEYYQQAVQIADKFGYREVQNHGYWNLAFACMFVNDFPIARKAAETARQYDFPQNNHNVCALLGVIALRQGDVSAAQEAFNAAIAHADKLLGYTAQNFDALDAKGLAICGLALCDPRSAKQLLRQAIEAFQASRKITAAAGIVSRLLRLFDALAVADTAGLLTDIRKAAAGM